MGIFNIIKKLCTLKWHVGAGQNLSPGRLVRQGMPYYLQRNGTAFMPMTMYININSRCNLKCRMCDIGQRNCESAFFKNMIGNEGKDFPIDRFKSLINEVHGFKPYICITTTEPLLYPHLMEAIEYTVSRGLKINITTNGFLLEKFAGDLVRAGLSRLSISIDGPPHVHDGIRGVTNVHERAMSGIKKVNEAKKVQGKTEPKIYLNTAIIDKNHASIIEMIEAAPLDCIEHWNLKLMVFCTQEMADEHNKLFGDKYHATETCLSGGISLKDIDVKVLSEQVKLAKMRCKGKCSFYFDESIHKLKKYFFEPHKFMDDTNCVMPWFVAQLTSRGDLIGLTRCYFATFGNILDRRFEDVWNDEPMRNFRRDLRKYGRLPACTRCDGVLFR